MQPAEESRYLLADDLSWPVVCRCHQCMDGTWKPGRMVIETSPRNYQVWIHSRRLLSLTEKRYWLNRLMSDPGADPDNRWGRCPGFRNRKEKHRTPSGHYPLSRLIWVDWTGPVEIPHTALELAVPTSSPLSHQPHGGGVCRQHLSRSDYDCGDESTTDFSYALALARRGYAPTEMRRCLLSERSNWHNHCGQTRMERYLDRTIRRVMALIERTRMPPGIPPELSSGKQYKSKHASK